jgi:hypothetical protein
VLCGAAHAHRHELGSFNPGDTERQQHGHTEFLTIGYMIARGLAKSGSREPFDDSDRR